MTVPMLFDLCRKRKWAIEFKSDGPKTGVTIKNSSGSVIGRSDSLNANEETFSMALLEASRKPSDTDG
jgi:hypothetical protein